MTWQGVLLAVLAGVDVAALAVGLTILRRVTRIVIAAGDAIHTAVAESIDQAKTEAVAEFTKAVGPALAGLAHLLPGALRQALASVRISAGGTVTVEERPEPTERVGQ